MLEGATHAQAQPVADMVDRLEVSRLFVAGGTRLGSWHANVAIVFDHVTELPQARTDASNANRGRPHVNAATSGAEIHRHSDHAQDALLTRFTCCHIPCRSYALRTAIGAPRCKLSRTAALPRRTATSNKPAAPAPPATAAQEEIRKRMVAARALREKHVHEEATRAAQRYVDERAARSGARVKPDVSQTWAQAREAHKSIVLPEVAGAPVHPCPQLEK